MQFSIQVPEVAQLPQSERAAVLKVCMQTRRFQRFRRFAPKVMTGALFLCVAVIMLLGWSPGVGAAVLGGVLILLVVAKSYGEFRLVRAEARKIVAAGAEAIKAAEDQSRDLFASESHEQREIGMNMKNSLKKILMTFAIGAAVLIFLMVLLYFTNPARK